ncbi:MAG: DegT/DnrJ/EryC1/StrS family aminotransferase [Acidobacteriota bacterium]
MKNLSRRNFLGAAAVGAAGFRFARSGASADKLAALGGSPVRSSPFPSWPVVGADGESAWMDVLRSHRWSRGNGNRAKQFEQVWAKTLGARHCLAVANGTSALYLSLKALGIGPGDEVIVPPYTFIATVNAVLAAYALPVFVDTDPETFQIDARRVDAAVTDRTRCLMPVHLGGSAADLDTILEVARKRRLTVIEDACQAHLSEWGGAKVGTLGDTGCFSFQASKNLNSGEGGAVVTNRADLYEFCESFHNNGRGFATSPAAFAYEGTGFNLRITEFQAALLLEQHNRLEAQSRVRDQNAAYLTRMLGEIEGIAPAKMYPKCTRNAYHLYMFRYDRRHFSGVARAVHRHDETGGNPVFGRLPAPQSRAVFGNDARLAGVPDHLRRRSRLTISAAERVSSQRPVVRRGRLADTKRVARNAQRYGVDCRSCPQDPGAVIRAQARAESLGSRLQAPGSRLQAPGSRLQNCGLRIH